MNAFEIWQPKLDTGFVERPGAEWDLAQAVWLDPSAPVPNWALKRTNIRRHLIEVMKRKDTSAQKRLFSAMGFWFPPRREKRIRKDSMLYHLKVAGRKGSHEPRVKRLESWMLDDCGMFRCAEDIQNILSKRRLDIALERMRNADPIPPEDSDAVLTV